MKNKMRVRFCWECSRQLRGDHYVECKIEGYVRVLHKQCHKEFYGGRKNKLAIYYPIKANARADEIKKVQK